MATTAGKPSPYDSELVAHTALEIARFVEGLGVEPETQAAALSVAAEIVRQRISGSVQALMIGTALNRIR